MKHIRLTRLSLYARLNIIVIAVVTSLMLLILVVFDAVIAILFVFLQHFLIVLLVARFINVSTGAVFQLIADKLLWLWMLLLLLLVIQIHQEMFVIEAGSVSLRS